MASPIRSGNKSKQKRSYIDKGPTKDQLERRSIVRGRLFADESESDDSNFNIPERVSPRRSRSESRGPSNRRKEKKRSLSAAGLSEMRKSLMRRANSIGKMATTTTTTPPPSPIKKHPSSSNNNKQERRTSDDIMSSAIKRVQERRKKKMEGKGVLIETFMMEDRGGVHYDSDDDSVCSNSSPTFVTTNLFYRGLQALEQIYLE